MASLKNKQMGYDHFFHESVRHAYNHVTKPVIPCGTPSVGEKSTHTWFAHRKGPHSSLANCSLHLAQWKRGGGCGAVRGGGGGGIRGGGGGGGGGGVGIPCLEARPQFGPRHAQWGSCLSSPWPPQPVVPEKQSCHVLCGRAWHCPGHTQNLVQKTPVAQGSILSWGSLM